MLTSAAYRSPEAFPALVLNADFRPLCYFPLSLWGWQTAVKAVFMDRVNIVSEYDKVVRSPSTALKLPSVIALKKYIRTPTHPAFTRFNLFLRDSFSCQYCGDTRELTFDHLVPRSQGGHTTWENVTAACMECNLLKGGRLPGQVRMWPRQMPYRPTMADLIRQGRKFPPNYLHDSWRDYLYWDTELED